MDQIEKYFTGEKLYGDDFTEPEIKKWYEEEEEAYAGLVSEKKSEYAYIYNSMNEVFGFRYIKDRPKFESAMGLGSAFGHEFLPYISKIQRLTILEPSDNLRSKKLGDITPHYVKPNIDGSIDFPNNSFDLITSFSVLHHIPNVSFVLSEMIRVLKPNGILLIREPIRTMGDWRHPRKGLTKNERGIPLNFFDDFFKKSKLEIVKRSLCDSNFAYRLLSKVVKIKRDSIAYQNFDKFISTLFKWNISYHPTSSFQKLAPASVFYVLRKLEP